jgi:hypothetical protein
VELQAGRENIRAESVFDILHNAAKRNEWELSLEGYPMGAVETHAYITWFEDLRVLYSQDFQTYDVVSD